ncbi:hypothetical protein HanRHA438_Chr16g0755091 [Helianthus annuus]|uniref:Stress response NST1-like protein n=1 Tax=Helianthus annuus TaxID=4232 RepID=A0A251S2M2_HELAN|nr:uncharacterized protein LOC110915111 [Helianthus annuus]XP_022015437.1 uncharacterized protein LOC110915111 [Helianthus annuus]KAF5759588.1 hypothetical protein HanXRQr2_Chr16g0743061 [Helianthus annuus]KAJ0437780.1 hypothetical protein HanHA300_Chr16g0606131 [Helianthus annuus]KAJ0442328.1 hypothetical protein HanIR_Chr16g0807941 [Helianthus annuus]KAJ0460101.1 hypothetical protein HanHA89_Chr16g0656691 [Helianthus annuus]KAJ0640544.1 hypothetical protein HanLR1_Chr16g0616721 [Helianthus 
MCILCVIQKWSRKVATMLPWLVIPLIALWLLSQFLPPAFRFEITSPRLACVLVLLATLFWYEILMPQLSSWRARRNARLKEKQRLEAIEMQKIRKTATRRCRNCKTPYRDQNPSGGKFMCSYCGHSSKRPLFDPSISPGLEQSGLKDLVGKVWSDNNWICGQDWLENGGYWVNGSFTGKSSYGKKNSGGFFNSGNDHFFSFLLVFVCKSLAAVFLGIMWLFRKLFRVSFSEDEDSGDTDINGLAKKGENGVNCNETRSEKARRKAEEKRQARLEREQLEEEERKQREEVARLVEERRKIRDEIDKKTKALTRDKNEAERKRQDRKKERDRGSSKSNSDVEELEKRASKEIERKLKGDADSREQHKSKVVTTNSYNKGSVGARYLDRMRGNIFPSSRTIAGGFFGKGVNAKANTSNAREHKSSAYLDHANKRDFAHPERAPGKLNARADDQSQIRPVIFESQPCPPPKRSWQQLFGGSSPAVSSTSTNVISRPIPNENPQTESQSSIVTQGFDNPISYGLPFPPLHVDSTTNTDSQFSSERVHRETEIYEDPCFVADPVADSFDKIPIDLGFLADVGTCDEKRFVSPRTPENTKLPVNDKGWQMWDSSLCPDALGLVAGNQNWYSPKKTTTSDDPWALRTPYGSIPSCLPENELGYGSAFNHPFQPTNDSVWAKKEKGGAPVFVEGTGSSTSGLLGPGDGLYSPPLQMYSTFGHMNDKEKQG